MTEQNGRLMKSFSQLEKLLNDMYGRQEGKGSVTVYIDLMKEKQQTDREVYDVDDWEEDLRSLKNIRYKRNKIAHECDAMDTAMCDEEDILWLEKFRERVMRGTDPLARLNREKQRKITKSVVRRRPAEYKTDFPSDYERDDRKKRNDRDNSPRELLLWGIWIAAFLLLVYWIIRADFAFRENYHKNRAKTPKFVTDVKSF